MRDLSKKIEEAIGGNVTVTRQEVRKNNGVVLEGYSVTEDDARIAPTFYPDQEDDDLAVDYVVEGYRKNKNSSRQAQMLELTEKITNNAEELYAVAVPTIVGHEANHEAFDASGVYYEHILDVDIVYRAIIDHNIDSSASIQITNSLIKAANVDPEVLKARAFDNIVNDARFQGMSEVLKAMLGPAAPDMPEDQERVYVLSNRISIYGASLMLYEKLLNEIHEKLNTDRFFILPSSIHEVLIIPDNGSIDMDVTELKNMVMEVNGSELKPEEILTDSVYVHEVGKTLEVA